MTTTVKIENRANSNGDVHIRAHQTWKDGLRRLAPGDRTEFGITDSSVLAIFETMPATRETSPMLQAGELADDFIQGEIARQDRMWGVANERADSANGELLDAAFAQMMATRLRRQGAEDPFATPDVFPKAWSGFRDYGSDVANLAVVAAYVRQEMKRLIAAGADTTRKSRDPVRQPYIGDQPTEYTK
jgi:hypothetical protein